MAQSLGALANGLGQQGLAGFRRRQVLQKEHGHLPAHGQIWAEGGSRRLDGRGR